MTPQHTNGFSKILATALLACKTATKSGKRSAQPQPQEPYGWRSKPTDARPEEDQLENLSGGELLDKFLQGARLYHFEGNTRNLEQVVEVLGYDGLEEFLGDNPGAQEAIVDFIREWADRNGEWKASLLRNIEENLDED